MISFMFHPRRPRHLRTGARGEFTAVWYLRLKGYRIVRRNFRCRLGEIDIIARKNGLWVFVEVRTRAPGALLHPLETVDPIKVARTVNAARTFLACFPRLCPSCRFDIVAVIAGRSMPVRKILHVPNAFDMSSEEYLEGCPREVQRRRRW